MDIVEVSENLSKEEMASDKAGLHDRHNDIQEEHAEVVVVQAGLPSVVESDQQMDDGQEYPSGYFTDPDMAPLRSRSTWPEKRIMGLLDIYINEYPVYQKAKMERQITEFHDYIGQIVNTDGILVAGLLKNLSREYRKLVNRGSGSSSGTLKLRGSRELFQKFEQYYQVYSKLSPQDSGAGKPLSKFSKPKLPKGKASYQVMPKIKKLKKTPKPMPEMTSFNAMMNPVEVKIPPVAVMSDKYCQEYIEVMREQNHALLEIGKELRLMRMGYFTEHELAMD